MKNKTYQFTKIPRVHLCWPCTAYMQYISDKPPA